MNAPKIIITVTNDLTFDQRMHRISSTLQDAGYQVTLVGRIKPSSRPLNNESFDQVRFKLSFDKGFLFYFIYNVRLAWYLVKHDYQACLAVDYDTLAACLLISRLRGKKIMVDCHEWYEEAPELLKRPITRGFWKYLGLLLLPMVDQGLSVTDYLARVFHHKSKKPFRVVRNMPVLVPHVSTQKERKLLIYQGVLNQDRGLPELIQAMRYLPDFQLWLCGEGDLRLELEGLVHDLNIEQQVIFKGNLDRLELGKAMRKAWLGFNLLTGQSKSYYYSLANKFFDYVHAGTPLITMDYPEYKQLIGQYRVGVMLSEITPAAIVEAIQKLKNNPQSYQQLVSQCLEARNHWHWDQEKQNLLAMFHEVLPLIKSDKDLTR